MSDRALIPLEVATDALSDVLVGYDISTRRVVAEFTRTVADYMEWCANHPKVTARVRDADGRMRCAHPDHNSPTSPRKNATTEGEDS